MDWIPTHVQVCRTTCPVRDRIGMVKPIVPHSSFINHFFILFAFLKVSAQSSCFLVLLYSFLKVFSYQQLHPYQKEDLSLVLFIVEVRSVFPLQQSVFSFQYYLVFLVLTTLLKESTARSRKEGIISRRQR